MKKMETILLQILIFVKYLCRTFWNVNIINTSCLLLLLFDKLIYIFSSIIGNITFSSFFLFLFLLFYDHVLGMHINWCSSLISSISFDFNLRTRYVLGNPEKSTYCWWNWVQCRNEKSLITSTLRGLNQIYLM